MAIESTKLLVAVKAFARGNALPLDKDEVQESYSAALSYASSATAYAGQTIKALVDGKYKTYVLQPGESGYTLDEVGAIKSSDLKQYVQIVDELPTITEQEIVKSYHDKIRDEIKQKCCITVTSETEPAITLCDVFGTIDKYRAERETKK